MAKSAKKAKSTFFRLKASPFLMLLLPLVIVLGNALYLFTNLATYKSIYLKENVYQNPQASSVSLDATLENTFAYINNSGSLDPMLFSQEATLHLDAIKQLIALMNLLFGMFLLCLCAVILFLISRNKVKAIFQACSITSGLMLIGIIPVWLILNQFTITVVNTLFQGTLLPALPTDDVLHVLYAPEVLASLTTVYLRNIMLTSAVVFALCALTQYKALKRK